MENAIKTFIEIAEDSEDYYEIKDELRSLHSFGDITDAEYDYILENWDNLLKEHGLM